MIQTAKKMQTLMMREYWENQRSIIWVPAGFAVLLSVLILMTTFGVFDVHSDVNFSDLVNMSKAVDEAGEQGLQTYQSEKFTIEIEDEEDQKILSVLAYKERVMNLGLHIFAIVFGFLSFILGITYLLSSLYTDRKDRSILFFKSLPFSETQVVFSKLIIALIVIPFVAGLFSIIVQIAFGLCVSYMYTGEEAGNIGIGAFILMMLKVFSIHGALIFIDVFKLLPLFSWLLFCSAWSKPYPMFVAFLTPFCLNLFERLMMGSNYIGSFFGNIFNYEGSLTALETGSWSALGESVSYYSTSEVLVGLVLSVVFVVGAIWLRNYKYEM